MQAQNKNYITPEGFAALRSEYQRLLHAERPKLVELIAWAASNGDRSENADYIYGKRRLREIDSRLRFLGKRLDASEVVDPTTTSKERVTFGAWVSVEDEEGGRFRYRIVGEDESLPEKGHISWKSPIARALMGRRPDEEVLIQTPKGERNFLILAIE